MTGFAIPPGLALDELTLMVILVAIEAFTKFCDGQRLPRFMAGFALELAVFAFKRKAGPIMTKGFIVDLTPFGCVMAGGAIVAKPPLVWVLVTVAACPEFQAGEYPGGELEVGAKRLRLVALFACGLPMLAGQGEAGFAVIEFGCGFPRVLLVARQTIVGKGALMGVLVAGEAFGVSQRLEDSQGLPVFFDGRFMTSFAIEGSMGAGQLEGSFVVVEIGRWDPSFRSVAAQTIFGHLATVNILVTCQAIRIQTEKASVQVFAGSEELFGIDHVGSLVTIAALGFEVGAGQLKSSQAMVELGHAFLPVDQFKVFAVVFRVA